MTDLFSEAVMVLRSRLAENDLNAAKIILNIVLPEDRLIEFGDDVSPAAIEAALADGAITPQEAYSAAQSLEKLQAVRDLTTFNVALRKWNKRFPSGHGDEQRRSPTTSRRGDQRRFQPDVRREADHAER